MDRDFILELFSEFGLVALRRMFSGFGVTADGVNFAMVLRDGIIFRVDEHSVAKYEAEGSKPFQYDTKSKTIIVKSYWHLPERLYDDPGELAIWAREAVAAAQRAAAKKPKKTKSAKTTRATTRMREAVKTGATSRLPEPNVPPKETQAKKAVRKERQAT